MSLVKLQQDWQSGVFDETPEPIMPMIINPESRALVYIDAYRSRLVESMEKIFVLLFQAMQEKEEEEFYELVFEYIDTYPSTHFSLSKLGENFSEFIKQSQKNPRWVELAELDWVISLAVEAKSAEVITRDYLKDITEDQWQNIRIKLHPSVFVLEKYRVYRKATQVYYIAINPQEKLFLNLIQQQKTFGEICEKLGETLSEEEAVNYAISQLLRWIDDELITAMVIKETQHELV